MGRVARIYKTSSVGQALTMDSTIVLFSCYSYHFLLVLLDRQGLRDTGMENLVARLGQVFTKLQPGVPREIRSSFTPDASDGGGMQVSSCGCRKKSHQLDSSTCLYHLTSHSFHRRQRL